MTQKWILMRLHTLNIPVFVSILTEWSYLTFCFWSPLFYFYPEMQQSKCCDLSSDIVIKVVLWGDDLCHRGQKNCSGIHLPQHVHFWPFWWSWCKCCSIRLSGLWVLKLETFRMCGMEYLICSHFHQSLILQTLFLQSCLWKSWWDPH